MAIGPVKTGQNFHALAFFGQKVFRTLINLSFSVFSGNVPRYYNSWNLTSLYFVTINFLTFARVLFESLNQCSALDFTPEFGIAMLQTW